MFLNKGLCANGISLRVETRIALLDEEHQRESEIFLDTFLKCRIGFLRGDLYAHGLS